MLVAFDALFWKCPLQISPGPFSLWPADGTSPSPLLPAGFAFLFHLHCLCVPHPPTWQMFVTRIDAVKSLTVTSCLVKGTRRKGGNRFSWLQASLQLSCFSLTHLLEKHFPVEADPTLPWDVRVPFPSMLFSTWKAPLFSVRLMRTFCLLCLF